MRDALGFNISLVADVSGTESQHKRRMSRKKKVGQHVISRSTENCTRDAVDPIISCVVGKQESMKDDGLILSLQLTNVAERRLQHYNLVGKSPDGASEKEFEINFCFDHETRQQREKRIFNIKWRENEIACDSFVPGLTVVMYHRWVRCSLPKSTQFAHSAF